MAPLDPLIPDSHELGLSLLLHNLIVPFLAVSPASHSISGRDASPALLHKSRLTAEHIKEMHRKQHTPEETHATPGRRELLLPAVVSRTVGESL